MFKRTKTMAVLLPILLSLFMTSCNDNSDVQLKFIQLPYIQDAKDSNGVNIGYYFENEVIAETTFTYKKGYRLTINDINSFGANNLNYMVPELNGDGYWSFTFFVTEFNEISGLSTGYLQETILDKSMNIYFGIFG